MIVQGRACGTALDSVGQRTGTPIFLVAGACPNKFCSMQAVVFCELQGTVDFWWVKPQAENRGLLEWSTLNLNHHGPFKNVAGRSRAVYQSLADKFKAGGADGDFVFGVDDTGRAFIEEARPGPSEGAGRRGRMLLYFVWQESWSSMTARKKFIQGKLCYQKENLEAGSRTLVAKRFFARQYKILGGQLTIATSEEEEEVFSLLPPDSFQEMYDMSE